MENPDPVRGLVEAALSTGMMLFDVLAGLVEDVPPDAFPGEEPAEVLIEMLTGSLRPVVLAAGEDATRAATALLGAMADKTEADLREALAIARRSG